MNDRDVGGPPAEGSLGLWSVISIILGIIIGAGIYETPPYVFSKMPDALTALAVWGGCGLLVLIGALCYAELATTYPRSGGDYVYLTRAYGPMIGYLFGWAQLAVIQTGSIGLMAFVFADYATRLYSFFPEPSPDNPDYSPVIYAATAVVAMTALNIAGVTLGKWAQNSLTLVKVLGLIGIVAVGFAYPRPELEAHRGSVVRTEPGAIVINESAAADSAGAERTFTVQGEQDKAGKPTRLRIAHDNETKDADGKTERVTLTHFRPGDTVKVVTRRHESAALRIESEFAAMAFPGLMGVMVLVLLTYGGWNDAAFVAAEVRNPSRNIPWALILGTLGVTAIYVLVNAAYVNGLGFEGAQDTNAVAADMLRLLPEEYGRYGEQAMCILVMISAIGAVNGLIFTSSRIYATLGQDYSLFTMLAPRSGGSAPIASLVLQLTIALVMILSVGTPQGQELLSNALAYVGQDLSPGAWVGQSGFYLILKCTAPIFWLFFLMTGLAVFWLRINDPIERPFRAPLFPLTPLIFCTMCGYMLYSGINYAGTFGWVGTILVLAGMPLYVFSRRSTAMDRA